MHCPLLHLYSSSEHGPGVGLWPRYKNNKSILTQELHGDEVEKNEHFYPIYNINEQQQND